MYDNILYISDSVKNILYKSMTVDGVKLYFTIDVLSGDTYELYAGKEHIPDDIDVAYDLYDVINDTEHLIISELDSESIVISDIIKCTSSEPISLKDIDTSKLPTVDTVRCRLLCNNSEDISILNRLRTIGVKSIYVNYFEEIEVQDENGGKFELVQMSDDIPKHWSVYNKLSKGSLLTLTKYLGNI